MKGLTDCSVNSSLALLGHEAAGYSCPLRLGSERADRPERSERSERSEL